MSRPATVVLVHGSWHGSWCWERVEPLLEARGLAVATVDLPSCGEDAGALADLEGDIVAVRRLLDGVDGPILLCAHSYGGAPVTVAAAGQERVRRIVYLGAFMLDAGESCSTIGGGSLPPFCLVRDDGSFVIDPAAAADVLYGDCDPATQAWATDRLVPQSVLTSTQTARDAAWHATPSTYVVCTHDRAIPPATERRLAMRAGERLELASSHSPFLSRPQEVAELLAARAG